VCVAMDSDARESIGAIYVRTVLTSNQRVVMIARSMVRSGYLRQSDDD
jgi:hypothetical protein